MSGTVVGVVGKVEEPKPITEKKETEVKKPKGKTKA